MLFSREAPEMNLLTFHLGEVFLNCHFLYLFARNDTNQHNSLNDVFQASRIVQFSLLGHLIEPEKSSML